MDNEINNMMLMNQYHKLVDNIWNDIEKDHNLVIFLRDFNELIKKITIEEIIDTGAFLLQLDDIIKKNNNNNELPDNILNIVINILIYYATNKYDNKFKKEIKIII